MRIAFMTAVLLLLFAAALHASEEKALERLMNIVANLQDLGDEMLGEPVTGSLVVGDTVSLELNMDSTYMYYVHVWSDSYFNVMDFWLADPDGTMQVIAGGDNASLASYPDTSGTWTLNICLYEGAYSDTASYAAAVFRGIRYLE
jgi:hypothetical protein